MNEQNDAAPAAPFSFDDPDPEMDADPEPFLQLRREGIYGHDNVDTETVNYQHDKTVKRYADLLGGVIKHWDPKRQAAHDKLIEENEAGLPVDNGPLMGVNMRAPGQATSQLLEVRCLIRQLKAKNEAALADAINGLEPGSDAYALARQAWQDVAMEDFITAIYTGHPALLPDVVSQSREWIKGVKKQTYETVQIYEDIGSFGNMISNFVDRSEQLFKFGHMSRLAILSYVVSLAGMAFMVTMRPALLIIGTYSSCKTYVYTSIGQILPPGVVDRVTAQTVKSVTEDADRNMKITIIDEAHGALIGDNSGQGETSDSATVKSAATLKEVIYRMLNVENGRRSVVESVSSRIGTYLLATNVEVKTDTPTVMRYIVVTADKTPANSKISVENKMYQYEQFKDTGMAKILKEQMQLDSFYVVLAELAIGSGTISDVRMDAANVYFEIFNGYMESVGSPLIDPKRKLQVIELVRTLCIMHACSIVFTSELTRSWRIDGATGLHRPLREILPRALREVERRLCCSMAASVYGFTLCSMLWKDPDWPRICSTISTSMLHLDQPKNGRPRVDLERKSRIGSLSAAGDSGDIGRGLQARISARVSMMTRADDECIGAPGDVDQTSGPSNLNVQGAGTAFDGSQGGVSGKEGIREAEMTYIKNHVDIPFMMLTDSAGHITIDPFHIKISVDGSYENVYAVAKTIRKYMARGVSAMSEEAIVRLLKFFCNEEITSEIYSYNVASKTIELDERFVGQKVRCPAIRVVSGEARGYARREESGSGRSNTYYIATALLVGASTFENLFEEAVANMAIDCTLRRKMITGIVCVDNAFLSHKGVRSGPKVKVWGVYRSVEIGPNPDRIYQATNFHCQTPSSARALAYLELGENATVNAVEDHMEANLHRSIGQFEITQDPEVFFAHEHAEKCGFPSDEYHLSAPIATDLGILDWRKGNRATYPATGFVYPDTKLDELLRENLAYKISRSRPGAMATTTLSNATAKSRKRTMAAGSVELMQRLGGSHVVDLASWNGAPGTRPKFTGDNGVSAERIAARRANASNLSLSRAAEQSLFSERESNSALCEVDASEGYSKYIFDGAAGKEPAPRISAADSLRGVVSSMGPPRPQISMFEADAARAESAPAKRRRRRGHTETALMSVDESAIEQITSIGGRSTVVVASGFARRPSGQRPAAETASFSTGSEQRPRISLFDGVNEDGDD